MPNEIPDPQEFQEVLETMESEPGSSNLQHPSREIHGDIDVLNIFEG